jgi:hypothetical protein
MTQHSAASQKAHVDEDPVDVSESEISAWAERERKRRKEWLEGPSEEEKRAWARNERRRRVLDYRLGTELGLDIDIAEGRKIADRFSHDATLALAGVASRLFEAPYRLLGGLMREGREWEDEYHSPPRRRRRVRLDDED